MNTQLDDGMRRIPLSRRSHITGFQPVRHKAVEHESALERDFVLRTSCCLPNSAIRPPNWFHS
ncbi:hypothetical protein IPC609_07620, partial [Pseudomonas aeruginosa]